MLTTTQKNNCLMIAKGTLKESDLKKPLSEEEKARVKMYKELYDERKKLKLNDLVDAMSVDE